MILPGFDRALPVRRKHSSLSLGMATFTLQLPNGPWAREMQVPSDGVWHSPLWTKSFKATQTDTKYGKQHKMEIWRNTFASSLLGQKLFFHASTLWLLVAQYHHLSLHRPGIQYLAVTFSNVREKHVNLIIYLPLRSTLTWNVRFATTRAKPCSKDNFSQRRAVPTCGSSESLWPSVAFL